MHAELILNWNNYQSQDWNNTFDHIVFYHCALLQPYNNYGAWYTENPVTGAREIVGIKLVLN